MRTTLIGVGFLLAAGAAVFTWQRRQIIQLRGQVVDQAAAIASNERNVDDLSRLVAWSAARPSRALAPLRTGAPIRTEDADGMLREDERRLIANQYRDVLAQMNLPPDTTARLQGLLEDRIEAVLDAEDAAKQEGFAEGSAEMSSAVALAIAYVDRDITRLLGADGSQRLNRLTFGPEPAEPAPPTVVTVVVNSAPEPQYAAPPAEAYSAPDETYASSGFPSALYYTYPVVPAVYVGSGRHGGERPFRPVGIGGRPVERRGR